MKILLKEVQCGEQYVYFDGYVIPVTADGVNIEGWHAHHQLDFVPQTRGHVRLGDPRQMLSFTRVLAVQSGRKARGLTSPLVPNRPPKAASTSARRRFFEDMFSVPGTPYLCLTDRSSDIVSAGTTSDSLYETGSDSPSDIETDTLTSTLISTSGQNNTGSGPGQHDDHVDADRQLEGVRGRPDHAHRRRDGDAGDCRRTGTAGSM